MKVIDFHIHLTADYPVEKSAECLRNLCSRHGYEGICIQTITHHNGFVKDANEIAMAVKNLVPGAYAFGCPVHDGTDYAEQSKRLMAQGFDGIKLLIGKPSEYRDLDVRLDDPMIENFFAWAEQEGIPVLLHNNDPEFHWDIEKISPSAIKNRWYYDPALMPSHEEFNLRLEKILKKFPRLRLALAHMGFYSNKLDRLTKLMESCPNLYMDITPALCIFQDLSATPEESREFFTRFGDRIFYGTDGWSDMDEKQGRKKFNDKKVKVIRHFLGGEGWALIEDQEVASIGLSPEEQEKITYWNALQFIKR